MVCPGEAISGEKKEVHDIDQEQCTRCRACFDVCPVQAIEIKR
jgi:Fe-S-cluster-containing hydrogenase component 2